MAAIERRAAAHEGILSDESPSLVAKSFEPFAQGLRDLGWTQGQNIAFERRYAELKYEILPGLAAELVRVQPNLILAIGTGAARAAQSATQTIPIVSARIGDPIGYGLVTSLSRPGGNLTGLSILTRELEGKPLQLLTTAVPDAKRVGVLWDPSFPAADPVFREIEAAARSLNVELVPAEVRGSDDFRAGFPGDGGAARDRSDRRDRYNLYRASRTAARPDGQGPASVDVFREGVR